MTGADTLVKLLVDVTMFGYVSSQQLRDSARIQMDLTIIRVGLLNPLEIAGCSWCTIA